MNFLTIGRVKHMNLRSEFQLTYQPDYWKSLDLTERRVFDENGYYLPVEDIYE